MKPKAVFLALAVSLALLVIFLAHVAKAGCCEHLNGCFSCTDEDQCSRIGGHFYSGRICCGNGYCKSSCSTTTIMTTTTCDPGCSTNADCADTDPCTVDRCVPAPDCGKMCTHTPITCNEGEHCENGQCVSDDDGGGSGDPCNPPPTDPTNCNNCGGSWGGCEGNKTCCLDEKVAACYDPPGGGRKTVCRAVKDGGTTILKNCWCTDSQGDKYVVGDCVTAGAVCDSGWYICVDRHYDYEGDDDTCSFVCASEGQCPAGGGSGGSGGSGGTTTIPYDVLDAGYTLLHNGTAPAYPVLKVFCRVAS